MLRLFAAAAAILAIAQPASAAPPPASAWEIGPNINGRNYSRGMPARLEAGRGGSVSTIIPPAPRSLHYVTFRHGPLTGKSRIVMRYRIEAAPGVRILPRTAPQLQSMLTVYFQRAGDNWSAAGPFETYRWFASFASHMPVTPGEHQIVAPLNGNWTALERSTSRTSPAAFRAALAQADRVGFVLGGGDGLGHGVFATGPARLVVTDFRVE